MKSSFQLVVKFSMIIVFLCITPFLSGLKNILTSSSGFLDSFVYRQKTIDQSISLKNQLNVLSYNSNLTIPNEDIVVETTKENPQVVPSIPNQKETQDLNQKKVYIYNTHQSEGYSDQKTVMDGAAILGKKLEEKGIKVVLETNDFSSYLKSKGLDYNKSYVASYKYLNDALVNYGGFDLCIDFHRDSIPREASIINIQDKTYAKAMMVVGGLGKNASNVTTISTTLTDIINTSANGMMRSVMTREAYYNQEVTQNTILMEVGGDVNSFEEIQNSLDVIAEGIASLLSKEASS